MGSTPLNIRGILNGKAPGFQQYSLTDNDSASRLQIVHQDQVDRTSNAKLEGVTNRLDYFSSLIAKHSKTLQGIQSRLDGQEKDLQRPSQWLHDVQKLGGFGEGLNECLVRLTRVEDIATAGALRDDRLEAVSRKAATVYEQQLQSDRRLTHLESQHNDGRHALFMEKRLDQLESARLDSLRVIDERFKGLRTQIATLQQVDVHAIVGDSFATLATQQGKLKSQLTGIEEQLTAAMGDHRERTAALVRREVDEALRRSELLLMPSWATQVDSWAVKMTDKVDENARNLKEGLECQAKVAASHVAELSTRLDELEARVGLTEKTGSDLRHDVDEYGGRIIIALEARASDSSIQDEILSMQAQIAGLVNQVNDNANKNVESAEKLQDVLGDRMTAKECLRRSQEVLEEIQNEVNRYTAAQDMSLVDSIDSVRRRLRRNQPSPHDVKAILGLMEDIKERIVQPEAASETIEAQSPFKPIKRRRGAKASVKVEVVPDKPKRRKAPTQKPIIRKSSRQSNPRDLGAFVRWRANGKTLYLR